MQAVNGNKARKRSATRLTQRAVMQEEAYASYEEEDYEESEHGDGKCRRMDAVY